MAVTLEELEKQIRGLARRYGYRHNEIDDLAQIGRIAVWMEMEKDPQAPPNFLIKVAKEDIIDYIRGQTREKRKPEALISLDTPLEKEGQPLEERVGKEDLNFQFIERETLVEALRERYGKFYIKGIREEKQPRKIVHQIIRVAIEEIAGIPRAEIPQRASAQLFDQLGLMPLIQVFYNSSPVRALMDTYPGEYFPTNFRKVPQRFWSGRLGYKNAVEAVAGFAQKQGLASADDCRRVRRSDFVEAGLGSMLEAHFGGSQIVALQTRFPELKPWQTTRTPSGYFESRENRIAAVVAYLQAQGLPSILGLSDTDVYELGIRTIVSKERMDAYGLRGLFKLYNGSTYRLFKDLFPEQIHPWTLAHTQEAWRENPLEIAGQAGRWLFEEYLVMTPEEIPQYATIGFFYQVGFSGLLTNTRFGFSSSPFAFVDNAYPGVYSKEDFVRQRKIERFANLPNLRAERQE